MPNSFLGLYCTWLVSFEFNFLSQTYLKYHIWHFFQLASREYRASWPPGCDCDGLNNPRRTNQWRHRPYGNEWDNALTGMLVQRCKSQYGWNEPKLNVSLFGLSGPWFGRQIDRTQRVGHSFLRNIFVWRIDLGCSPQDIEGWHLSSFRLTTLWWQSYVSRDQPG